VARALDAGASGYIAERLGVAGEAIDLFGRFLAER
jgi:hypothetical protein